ncbi:MAG: DUF58 domain-containing protein, partial [Candidatus Omnitrophica bacterium]|nr:DUF58 domain-containing protein [Candidatus Omnitrophota bacterium]
TRIKSEAARTWRVKNLLQELDARDACAKGSPEWRLCNRRVLSMCYDQLLDTVNDTCLNINKLFERVVYRESARHLLDAEDTLGVTDSNNPLTATFERDMFVRRVEDWINGYHPPSPREQALDGQVFDRLRKKLNHAHHRRRARQALRIAAAAIVLAGVIVTLKISHLDNQIWDTVSTRAKKLIGLDPLAVRMRTQSKFFADQIRAIKDTYSEETILENMRAFENLKTADEQEKALFYAQHVLKGYFLLLTDWETSAKFKEKILKGAREYDADIHHHMHSLTVMFSSDKMTESHFQIHTLMLRKAFVQKGVFPFLFLSLYKDQPYVFLYPERIIDEFHFDAGHLETLGINVPYYSHAANIPLVAHVIEGKTYPFKDRAGYFEGQYAIVFNHIAGNTQWTAFHEFGHSIDQMRFMFGQVAYPLNVETHSMLFPLLFADNPGRYAQNKLLGSVAVADPKDLYVQASKGILNGIILQQKKHHPELSVELITDDLNKQTIAGVRQWMSGFSDEQLRTIARELYRDSPAYLTTAKGGTYRGHFANAEEIVAGAHGPPTQSFLVDEFGKGDFAPGGSTRFIRDTAQQAPPPKDLWSFIKAVIYITLHPKATTGQRNSAEALVSSILIFILIEALLIAIQWFGSPIRKRKFNGVLPKNIIQDIYDHHPWSDGKSAGEEKGERQLLEESFESAGTPDPRVTADIAAFRAAADKKRKVLLDVCLTLAPWVPQRSAVKSRWHNLLFWLPFLGPWLSRWPWLMPKQRPFQRREAFNREIKNLCAAVKDDTPLDEFLDSYKHILLTYQSTTERQSAEYRNDIAFMDALEKQVHDCINAAGGRTTLRKPMVTHRAIQNYHEDVDFDRLDKYVYGDDIKRIDWRATARAVNNEPIVRKSSSVYGLNVGFLLDFREMHEYQRREQFALDFVKSLRMLGKDRFLKQLILVMPNGEIFSQRVHIKFSVSPHQRARQLWRKVKATFEDNLRRKQQLDIPGLAFYCDEENARYRERFKLTEFPYTSTEGIIFEKLNLHNLNIFLIGMAPEKRPEVPHYLAATNQVFFW